MQENIVNYILAFSIALVFSIACLVSFRRRGGDRTPAIFLSLMYWVFVYALISVFIFDNGWVQHFPHLFRTVQVASLLYAPLSYLYIRQTLKPRQLKNSDLLHLLPAIVFVLDYAPFFLLSAAEKIRIFESLQGDKSFFRFDEGLWMPTGGHIVLRYLVMIGYWVASLLLIARETKSIKGIMPADQQKLVLWLKWLVASQAILIFPPLLNIVFEFFPIGLVNGISAMIAALVQAYFLLFHPDILYGFFGEIPQINENRGSIQAIPAAVSRHSKAGIRIAEESPAIKQPWMQDLAAKLELHFDSQKPFLQRGYSLSDLARELDCTTNQVSYLVNNHYGINFNRLINQYRVEACKEKILNREFQHKTLEAIAQESGFTSRATFISAFKSETGSTPSGFINEMADNSV